MQKKDFKILIDAAAVPYAYLDANAKSNRGYLLECLLRDRACADMNFLHKSERNNRVLVGISRREWDTQQLGVECGSVDWLLAAGTEIATASLLGELAEKVQEKCAKSNIALLTCKVGCGQLPLVHGLSDWGMKIVDCELVWAMPSRRQNLPPTIPGVIIRNTQREEIKGVGDLGHTFQFDRFHADYRIDGKRADELWAASIYNACAERADQVVIAKAGDKAIGVVTCFLNREAVNHLTGQVCDFVHVAVDPQWRGLGIAKAMLVHALNWAFEVANFAQVGTQSRNFAANSLYRAMGFNLVHSQYSMHAHWPI